MVTSAKSMGSQPSALSRVITTSARPVGLRCWLPAKMTSSARRVRSERLDCSPSTQRTASAMFDLPLPFGPMTALTPRSNTNRVGSAKVLKPWRRSSRRRLTWTRSAPMAWASTTASRDARRLIGATLQGRLVAAGGEQLERRVRRLLLGALTARSLANGQAPALQDRGDGEGLLVRRSDRADQLIEGLCAPIALGPFLEPALGG